MSSPKLSQFQYVKPLGSGGMGVVFLAYDKNLKRNVAVKTLSQSAAANETFRKRFLLEAEAAAALNHPNIASIYETFEAGKDTYIVMEYVDGEELEKKISKGKLVLTEALDYAVQIAEGLKEAHSKRIVHRDIKSANIIITRSNRAKIMDFGLAKIANHTQITR